MLINLVRRKKHRLLQSSEKLLIGRWIGYGLQIEPRGGRLGPSRLLLRRTRRRA
jgi:hypothetical protein